MLLYKQYHRQLNAYCIALTNTRDDAKDLMSATIEIAYTKFNELKEEDRVKISEYARALSSMRVQEEKRKATNT